MEPREVFQQYVRERRHEEIEGQQREELPYVTRYTPSRPGADGLVVFADIPPGSGEEAIKEQLRFFGERRLSFEWKVYAFDTPPNLRDLLLDRGFVPEATEVFAVLPLDDPPHFRDRSGVEIRRVTDDFGISAMVAVQKLIWKKDFTWLGRILDATLENRPDELYGVIALAGGRPVGCGWMNCPAGSAFADLHGGCVLPDYRGRGVYRALLNARIVEAQRRALPYLAVDAAPMSRPIIEHLGFQIVCETWPMKWRQSETD